MIRINFERPKNCFTILELQEKYDINKQKIYRAIRSGKLNGSMVESDGFVELKWYIKSDLLLDEFLNKSKKK